VQSTLTRFNLKGGKESYVGGHIHGKRKQSFWKEVACIDQFGKALTELLVGALSEAMQLPESLDVE
jgi:hypothetical protein